MFPIKYIDNNLIFNHNGECFAYYEMRGYNYSFLSPEEKLGIHTSFRQLVAQSREGMIHALEISTESSIRIAQEKAKKYVKGNLANVALDDIDRQTELLTGVMGEMGKDNQVDYRFYIGFKLVTTDNNVVKESVIKKLKSWVSEFLYGVNHELMGDFAVMENDLLDRYFKMERLLFGKICRRFSFRPLDRNDFGYLIEHLHGQVSLPYEEYEYNLMIKKYKKEKWLKRYDLYRPIRCEIIEHKRYLEINGEVKKQYVSYFVINDVVGELAFPSSEFFYYQQQQFTFPVDVSMNVEIVPNKKAMVTVRNKEKELVDSESHAYDSGNNISRNMSEALEDVSDLQAELQATKESMYKLNYVIRVSADDLEELTARCDNVRDYYDDAGVKLIRPSGDQLGLHGEFIFGSKRYQNDYIQYVTSDFLAGLGFGATQVLGDDVGIYIGWNKFIQEQNIYINPWLPAQGIAGTNTNALAMSITGALGGGKSYVINLIVNHCVRRGAKALVIDPKSERGNWKEDLPELGEELNIINLTSEESNRGALDPFVIFDDVELAKSAAIDILTFLTGVTLRDSERLPVLVRALDKIAESENRGLLQVVDYLQEQENEVARKLADHIESFKNYAFAKLLLSDGSAKSTISADRQLNIIQIADLIMPSREKTIEEYSATEMLSVAMLIVVSTFAVQFAHSERDTYKIVCLDEAWSVLQVAQGQALFGKLVREGRSLNTAVYFVTQSCDDFIKGKMQNYIGFKFAFRSNDIDEIKQTLTYFDLDSEDEGNQNVLRALDNGQCLFQDSYGRVGVVCIDLVFPHFAHAFDTRPPEQKGA